MFTINKRRVFIRPWAIKILTLRVFISIVIILNNRISSVRLRRIFERGGIWLYVRKGRKGESGPGVIRRASGRLYHEITDRLRLVRPYGEPSPLVSRLYLVKMGGFLPCFYVNHISKSMGKLRSV